MQQLNYPIIKLTLCLVLGILFGYFIHLSMMVSVILVAVFIGITGISFIVTRKHLTTHAIFAIGAFATTFSLGILAINTHNQSLWDSHYSHAETFEEGKRLPIQFTIIEILKPSLYQDKYVAQINRLDQDQVLGKILINVNTDSLTNPLKVDDIVLTKAELLNINTPMNPHQFNYKAYLKKQYIYHQIHTSHHKLLVSPGENTSILGFAETVRESIQTKLQLYNFKADELAIINAILLGQRRHLSKAIYNDYAAAGAIHILAVSGLHVGIILMLLQALLKPLNRLKRGKVLKIILLVGMLWTFAIIAGLSPSVVRAVTMFSIVAIGINLKRPSNIYNTLAISMFVLLLIKPMFLFDVGFQLSYLAVFAIVWIQPMLYSLWQPKLQPIDYFWQIFTVTMAAQIGVAPLSLFYFNQFPGLFFVSNLVIIPVLGLILGFGILMIALAMLNILPAFAATAYGYIIGLLNNFVGWIAEQEAFVFKGISFGIASVILSYVLIVFSIRFLKAKQFTHLVPVLMTIIIIQSVLVFEALETSESFTVFHKSRHSLMAFQKNKELQVYHNLIDLQHNTTINDYMIGEQINKLETDSLKSVYRLNNKLLLVIDSMGVYKTRFKPDIILLRNSPKVNLERVIAHINPELIIADGSNYKSYIDRWEGTCIQKKLPFHATAKKGALIIDYAEKSDAAINTNF